MAYTQENIEMAKLFEPKLIKIEDKRALRATLREDPLIDRIAPVKLDWLNNDTHWAGLEWFVSRLDSNRNFYKVESHMILTKMIFLTEMSLFQVGFDPSNQIIAWIGKNDTTYYMYWQRPEDLLTILWTIMEISQFNPEDSDLYEIYRHYTRKVTDHLEETHQPRETWKRILKLSYEFFMEHHRASV